jgi:DNA-binding transcriptional LysR family regulator
VLEFHSYHAIVACVAAGAGIAIVPRSVIAAVGAEPHVQRSPLPHRIAQTKTRLVWRKDQQSTPLRALREQLRVEVR